jgi:hypothetical protein
MLPGFATLFFLPLPFALPFAPPPPGSYQARVVALGAGGGGLGSAVITVSVVDLGLVFLEPADGATVAFGELFDFRWSAVSGATSYRLELVAGAFVHPGDPAPDPQTLGSFDLPFFPFSGFSLGGLLSGPVPGPLVGPFLLDPGPYQARVLALGASGEVLATRVVSLTVVDMGFRFVEPTDGTIVQVGDAFEIRWTAVVGADHYLLEVIRGAFADPGDPRPDPAAHGRIEGGAAFRRTFQFSFDFLDFDVAGFPVLGPYQARVLAFGPDGALLAVDVLSFVAE